MAQLITFISICITFLATGSAGSRYGNDVVDLCPEDLVADPSAETGTMGSACLLAKDGCNDGLECCRTTFTGRTGLCSDIDECSSGADDCDTQATCTNTVGSFTCSCNEGFIGNGTSCRGCPDHSYLNPVTETCFRLIVQNVVWSEAKSICEAEGEFLLTFPLLEAVQWFDDFKLNTPLPLFWVVDAIWIGLAVEDNTTWRWQGLINSTLSESDDRWGEGDPDDTNNDLCGYVAISDNVERGVFESACEDNRFFICEKRL